VVSFPNGREIEAEVADTPEKNYSSVSAFERRCRRIVDCCISSSQLDRTTSGRRSNRFPVDMMWVDESHHIVGLKENVAPCQEADCPKYSSSPEAVRYAIQTEAGFIKREGITIGQGVKYTLRM